ncbi:MAG: DEAD/DEAH box helicase, partial [Rhodospirillales bacterium]
SGRMKDRPYFEKGIHVLEALFEQSLDDPDVLFAIRDELVHRKAKRAQRLLERVQNSLTHDELPLAPPAAEPLPEPMSEAPKVRHLSDTQQAAFQLPLTTAVTPPEIAAPVAAPVEPTHLPQPVKPPDFPAITNRPSDILSAWTALEVLSPASFRKPEDLAAGDRYRIAKLDGPFLPWQGQGEKSRPKYRLYYQIVLSTVLLETAVGDLLKLFPDSRPEPPGGRGEAVLASITLDKLGVPVAENPVAVSSFAWALPIALRGDFKALGTWRTAENQLAALVQKSANRSDADGNPLPLAASDIDRLFDLLVATLGLEERFVTRPRFAVRAYQYIKDADPPEPLLLNSFFLGDLARASDLFDEDKAPSQLKRYLGQTQPSKRVNLLTSRTDLAETLRPARFPLASWPAAGRFPLALLQQSAVNLAIGDLKDEGILAVNGPPGTGKTTLLRDVIAAIVTNRALVMADIDDPEKAFKHSGQKVRRSSAFLHLYKVDDHLKGFEIVVASSNNKAVENVSKELPGKVAVAEDSELRYFKTAFDELLKNETWGAIAAVLGNAANRHAFRQTFWWHEDCGLRLYFQHAAGTPQNGPVEVEGKLQDRPPKVISVEQPPLGHEEALRRWTSARKAFRMALKRARLALKESDDVYLAWTKVSEAAGRLAEQQAALAVAQNVQANQERASEADARALSDLRAHSGPAEAARKAFFQRRPGFFARLFNLSSYKAWLPTYRELEEEAHRLNLLVTDAEAAARQSLAKLQKATTHYQSLADDCRALADQLATLEALYAEAVKNLGGMPLDTGFIDADHAQAQLTNPWLAKKHYRTRQDLFETAMDLHKAFVDAAAKPIRHNLSVLFESYGTKSLGDPAKDALIPDLWATLFLLVPAVSTTFASVDRMFPNLGPQSLGWLLIDEAGQALPQAAVGALMRTKRALVVGDPLQIEPVVVLPERLTEGICRSFGADPLLYNAPSASAQTLADAATAYFASFETTMGSRDVGVPLLVHRRCSEPMFSMSNVIAYEKLMVQAKAEKPSLIRDCLGPSRWIHVEGRGEDKWCPAEGAVVIDLLKRLKDASIEADLYIVTPFVAVQNGLRDLVTKSGTLTDWVDNPYTWPYEHIGTIHTVQGREAEAVIFVLGAPLAQQQG